ncbi:uncharacterized protein [Ptychodera flava]|uniref:uncharacterized protein n=1 Tax=Ptychodera flava TaxID=63121 RepID=UPI00396AA592
MATNPDSEEGRQDFSLNTGSQGSDFQNRSKDVFGGLKVLEESYHQDTARWRNSEPQHEEKDDSDQIPQRETQECTKPGETDFKVPKVPSSRRQKEHRGPRKQATPDYVLHPYSWKKYSLSETGEENMGVRDDELNRKIALDFLKQCKKTNEESQREKKEEDEPTKIVFRKPVSQETGAKRAEVDQLGVSPFIDHTHRMPEYVVGREKHSSRKRTFATAAKSSSDSEQSSSLKLEHLDESNQSGDSAESLKPIGSQSKDDNQSDVSTDPVTDHSELQKSGFRSFKGKKCRKIRTRAQNDDEPE